MNKKEREILLSMLSNNFELNRLYKEHQELEDRLGRYNGKNFLTASEEVEMKRIKSLKLRGVDKIMKIIEANDLSATVQ